MSNYITQVARSVPFDNTTNGFTATDVQAAIEEAQNTLDYIYLSSNSTVSTTSGTYSVVSGMTTTPAAGTYFVLFTGTFRIADNNADGNFAIFKAGTIVTESTRRLFTTVSILLGLLNNSIGASGTPMAVVTVDGTQTIDGRFRSTNGNAISCDNRTMILIRVLP